MKSWIFLLVCGAAIPSLAIAVPFENTGRVVNEIDVVGAMQADLDSDGDPDFIYASRSQNRVSWSRNERGSYSGRQTLIGVSAPVQLAVADFDRDGRTDLVTITAGGVLTWHRQTGTDALGTPLFETRPAAASDLAGARRVATGDLNRDGRADLVVACDSGVAIRGFLFGGGSGSGFSADFGAAAPPQSGLAGGIAIADIDGNGFGDIVASFNSAELATPQQSTLAMWARNSTAYASPVALDSQSASSGTARATFGAPLLIDLDRINGPDIVYSRNTTGGFGSEIVVRSNTGSGVTAGGAGVTQLFGFNPVLYGAMATGDIDRNGQPDLVVLDDGAARGQFLSQLDTAFLPSLLPGDALPGTLAAFVSDDDLDGDPDIVIATVGGGFHRSENRRIHGRAFIQLRSVPVTVAPFGALSGPFEVAAARVGRGALKEVLFTEPGPGRMASVRLQRSGVVTLTPTISNAPIATGVSGARSLHVIDVDADGDDDFLLGTGEGGTAPVSNQNRILLGANNGGYAVVALTCAGGDNVQSVSAARFANGSVSVAYAALDNDRIAVTGSCPVETLVSTTTNGVPNGPTSVEAADLDQDGDADLLIAAGQDTIAAQQGDLVGWYPNDGAGNFGALRRIGTVEKASDAVAIDVDRDGRLDVVTGSRGDVAGDATQGRVLVFRNLGAGVFSTALVAASGIHLPGRVASGDPDHDGDIDLFVPSDSPLTDTVPRTQCGISFLEALSPGVFASAQCLDNGIQAGPWSRLAVDDFDHDGQVDVAAASVVDNRLVFVVSLFLDSFRVQHSGGAPSVVLQANEEHCPRSFDVIPLGRDADSDLAISRFTLQAQGTDPGSMIASVHLRRDDGDAVAEPAQDVEVAVDTVFADQQSPGWSMAPIPPLANQAAAGPAARYWVCVRAPSAFPTNHQGVTLRSPTVNVRDAISGEFVQGPNSGGAAPNSVRVVPASVFKDGLEG